MWKSEMDKEHRMREMREAVAFKEKDEAKQQHGNIWMKRHQRGNAQMQNLSRYEL